jgi:hypothetical protein
LRKLTVLLALVGAAILVFPTIAMAQGNGVGGPAFYVNGELYRTKGTPTDLSGTGAPAHSFDTIYQFFGAQDHNVATAAPGDRDYNGGRWMVIGLQFDDYDAAVAAWDANGSGDFDSEAEVHAALDAGDAVSLGVVKQFVCPVIPLPQHS